MTHKKTKNQTKNLKYGIACSNLPAFCWISPQVILVAQETTWEQAWALGAMERVMFGNQT